MIFKRACIILLVSLLFSGCPESTGSTPLPSDKPSEWPSDGVNGGTVTLTVGRKHAFTLPADFDGKTVTWKSRNTNIATVDSVGNIKAVGISSRGSNTYVSGAGTGSTTVMASAPDVSNYFFTVNTTTAGTEDIMNLSPMKNADQIGKHFPLVGNIFNPGDINGTGTSGTDFTGTNGLALKRHYNILTMENNMKPGYLISGRNNTTGALTWNTANRDTANRMINGARAQNVQIVGHALLWHSQNPNWVWEQIATKSGAAKADKETALEAMRTYITTVVTHFQGKIYSWDVLNEVFPDNASRSNANSWKTAMRKGASGEGQDANPWFVAIGSDFVYEAFLAARLADPNAILYYNDYNTDNSTRADLIRDMALAVNNQYKAAYPSASHSNNGTRNLIEGIGMQEHHNLSVQANSVRTTLSKFRAIGVKVAVSELDVLGNASYGAFSSSTGAGINKHGSSAVTNTQLVTQAQRFAEYMAVYIEYKDIIERISLWGVTDNNSWRSGGLPLLFDKDGKAKPAYYRFLEAAAQ